MKWGVTTEEGWDASSFEMGLLFLNLLLVIGSAVGIGFQLCGLYGVYRSMRSKLKEKDSDATDERREKIAEAIIPSKQVETMTAVEAEDLFGALAMTAEDLESWMLTFNALDIN